MVLYHQKIGKRFGQTKKRQTEELLGQQLQIEGWKWTSCREKIQLREQRNMLLQECDWTQSPGSPLSSDKKTEWATYRTNLRNLPASYDLVDDTGFAWPTKPS